MPMTDDLSGLPTSLSEDLIGDWNRVIIGILSHAASTGPDLNRVLAAAPDFALGQAIRGLSCLLLGRSEMVAVAREAHAAAVRGAPATPRETGFVEALGDWLNGRPGRAAARMQVLLTRNPRDALAMKLIQAIHFVMGRPDAMRASVEGVLGAWTIIPRAATCWAATPSRWKRPANSTGPKASAAPGSRLRRMTPGACTRWRMSMTAPAGLGRGSTG